MTAFKNPGNSPQVSRLAFRQNFLQSVIHRRFRKKLHKQPGLIVIGDMHLTDPVNRRNLDFPLPLIKRLQRRQNVFLCNVQHFMGVHGAVDFRLDFDAIVGQKRLKRFDRQMILVFIVVCDTSSSSLRTLQPYPA